MARRFYDPRVNPVTSSGASYPGAKLYFYSVGTSTPVTVYSAYSPQNSSTSLGSVVTADGNGVFPEIYLGGSQNLGYRTIMKTSAGVIVYDYNVYNKPDGLTTGEVGTSNLADGSVTTVKLATNAVTAAKITDGVINGGTGAGVKIAASTITANNLATDCVTTAKVLDLNITTAKLAASAVTAAKITDGIITGGAAGAGVKLAAATITKDNMANTSIDTAQLYANAVTTAKITDLNVTMPKIAATIYKRLPINGSVVAGAATFVGTTPTIPETGTALTIGYAATGVYTITHNFNSTDYTVTYGSLVNSVAPYTTTKGVNSFVVSTFTTGAGAATAAGGFDFCLQRLS